MKKTQIAMLAAMFVVMCGLRLWFGLLLLFGLAIVMTFAGGRRNYCAAYCPMGALQDYYPGSSNTGRRAPKGLEYVRWPLFGVFWSYLAYNIITSYENPTALWAAVLLLIILSMLAILVLQTLYRRRIWCSKLCPFGQVLDGTMKARRLVNRSFSSSSPGKPASGPFDRQAPPL